MLLARCTRLRCHLRFHGARTVHCNASRLYRTIHPLRKTHDPRVDTEDHIIEDDFLVLRENYSAPKHPIVLAHGLLGFDELHPVGTLLPGIQ